LLSDKNSFYAPRTNIGNAFVVIPIGIACFMVDVTASPLLSFFLAKKKGAKKNATFSYRSAAKRSPTACFVEACYSIRPLSRRQ
jgi:hypothetical protein